jgi:hypothetical protein
MCGLITTPGEGSRVIPVAFGSYTTVSLAVEKIG